MKKKKCEGHPRRGGIVGVLASYSFGPLSCDYKASLFENGKWFCKLHAPSCIEERERKSDERMWEKVRKIQEQIKKEKENEL